jgi:hypothetical protein
MGTFSEEKGLSTMTTASGPTSPIDFLSSKASINGFRSPRSAHYVLIIWTAAVTVPACFSLVAFREVNELYSERLLLPPLERALGFTTARAPNWHGYQGFTPFVISSVVPGGPFDLAGFRVGDTFLEGLRHGDLALALGSKLERGLRVPTPISVSRKTTGQEVSVSLGPGSIPQ